MNHIPILIHDLAIILFSAGLITLIFKILKQPVVLGYIVAGFIAGPFFFGKWIGDVQNIRIWGDIGVIFLLFALGLEFSFRKLLHMGGTALMGAFTIVLGMMTTGYLTGQLLGWSDMNSLFLGGMLSMSSTTIVFKALDDMGLRTQRFAGIVFGILIVEDLLAVVLMVLLSTLAVRQQFEGLEMASSIIKLLSYLLFWFVGGIFIIPTFLKRMKRYLNDETLLVVSLGLCLGMVMLAAEAGFSAALGAFVMGSVLAETVEAEHIGRLVKPVKDLFGAIFFVSVGMMIDPALLAEHWFPIALITFVVIAGQIFFSGFGILLSGVPLKTAMQAGFSLAQIGEFAFIIAGLGVSLKVTALFLYPIVVAVSVITTFLTPYIMKLADPAYVFVERRLPASSRRFLDRYTAGHSTISHKTTWQRLLKELGKILLVYGVLTAFLVFLHFHYFSPFIVETIGGIQGRVVSIVVILVVISPFLRSIMMKKNHSREFMELWHDNRFNRGPLVGLVLLRVLLCIWCVMFIITKLFSLAIGAVIAIAVAVIAGFIYSRQLKMQSIKLERRFLRNLSARAIEEEKSAPVRERFVKTLLSRDIHLADFEVSQYSRSVGKQLKELDFRRKTGVNIVKIVRGDRYINIPGGEEVLFPFDNIVVAGTDKQIDRFRKYVEENARMQQEANEQAEHKDVSLEQFLIEEGSALVGKSIKRSHIRDKANCLVLGIERGESSLMNPESTVTFQSGDLVLVAGERQKLENMLDEVNQPDDDEDVGSDWVIEDK